MKLNNEIVFQLLSKLISLLSYVSQRLRAISFHDFRQFTPMNRAACTRARMQPSKHTRKR